MRQDRFLTGILIAIGVLAVLAVALFFLRQTRQEYSGDPTPEGVAHNYTLALQNGDYQRAYGYLASGPGKPEYARFRLDLANQRNQFADAAVEIQSAEIAGEDATVSITVLRGGGGLFNDITRDVQNASLKKEGQDWKIVQMPYPYWSFDWYQPTPKSVPAP